MDNTESQAAFRERKRKLGYIKATEWIPANDKEEHKVFVAKLNRRHERVLKKEFADNLK